MPHALFLPSELYQVGRTNIFLRSVFKSRQRGWPSMKSTCNVSLKLILVYPDMFTSTTYSCHCILLHMTVYWYKYTIPDLLHTVCPPPQVVSIIPEESIPIGDRNDQPKSLFVRFSVWIRMRYHFCDHLGFSGRNCGTIRRNQIAAIWRSVDWSSIFTCLSLVHTICW